MTRREQHRCEESLNTDQEWRGYRRLTRCLREIPTNFFHIYVWYFSYFIFQIIGSL